MVVPTLDDEVASTWRLVGGITIPSGLVLSAVLVVAGRAQRAGLAAQIDNARRKLNYRRLTETVESATDPTSSTGGEYFGSLVRINVDNLSDYYTQVRVHTNNSFWASISAGAVGFLSIVSGVVVGLATEDSLPLALVTTASGVIIEFISGTFFYLYNKTVRQLKDYHDSLLDVQNILLSFRIVEQAGDDQRGALFEKILDFLLKQRATS